MNMTEEKEGQTIAVVYSMEESISNEQARELIQNNAPAGLTVRSFDDSNVENAS